MERSYLGAESFALRWSVVVAVLLLCLGSRLPAVSAQAQSGFLNIDCGETASHVDPLTGYTWVPDTPYINSTGKTQAVVLPAGLQDYTELKSLRYFDDQRPKNCFTLPVVAGKYYLLRTTFFYGNFDNKNSAPTFGLAVDSLVTDNFTAPTTGATYKEYTYKAEGSVTYLCLVRTSPSGTPFISGISLKSADNLVAYGYSDSYSKFLTSGVIMKTRVRVNYGASNIVRGPDDYYDRFWFPESAGAPYYLKPTTAPLQYLSTTSNFSTLVNQGVFPPSAVMQTAVASSGVISSYIEPSGFTGTDTNMYMSVYYGELNVTTIPVPRNFSIDVLGTSTTEPYLSGVFLDYNGHYFWPGPVSVGQTSVVTLTPLAGSPAGPIMNAMEVFSRSDPRVLKTNDSDALAIAEIQKALNLSEWSGDPCLPVPHSWITCNSPNQVAATQPQIIAVNLSGYQLEGAIPDGFADLAGLTSLILANNKLSGVIPGRLAALANLKVLSVENNNLSPPVPDALLSPNSRIKFTVKPGNPLIPGLDSTPASPQNCTSNCDKKSNIAVIVGASVGGLVGLILIIVIAIVAYRRCNRTRPTPSGNQGKSPASIPTTGHGKAYTLAEVYAATNQLSRELGKGGFGPVYYGKLPGGKEVAVKVSDGSSNQGEREFFNEVDVLSLVHHRNLVSLVGYCQEQKQILIYEYMPNGSLFDILHGRLKGEVALDWRTRLNIALNAAQGLEYLHTGCSPSFIHRDVKSSNILLTPKYEAKVADFGLTKLMGETESTRVMTNVMGTAGYLDPEYYTTQYLSSKSDVYSFGIVLLELISGRIPIDRLARAGNTNIADWARESLKNSDIDAIVDPVVKASNPNMEAVWKVAEIALRSVEPKGVHRPTMPEVVQELQGALMMEGSGVHSRHASGLSDYTTGPASDSGSHYGPMSYPSAR